jgi:hypothetical protein
LKSRKAESHIGENREEEDGGVIKLVWAIGVMEVWKNEICKFGKTEKKKNKKSLRFGWIVEIV